MITIIYYLAMLFLTSYYFGKEGKELITMFICFAVLAEYYKDFKFPGKKTYTFAEIKQVIKGTLFFMMIPTLIAGIMISLIIFFSSDVHRYLNYIYSTFVLGFFSLFLWVKKTKNRNILIKFIANIIPFIERHPLVWGIYSLIFIPFQNFYMNNKLFNYLIPIFSFFPPVIAILDTERKYRNKIIKYSILVITSLLCLVILEESQIANFTFVINEESGFIILLSLIKLLITSYCYFGILQVLHFIIKSCTSVSIKN